MNSKPAPCRVFVSVSAHFLVLISSTLTFAQTAPSGPTGFGSVGTSNAPFEFDDSSACHLNWKPSFGGFPGTDTAVFDLTVIDDGNGQKLYVAGQFLKAGGLPMSRVAMFDGSNWSPLGDGVDSIAFSLQGFDDGSGLALYAGGRFSSDGGLSTSGIAKWDGASWSPVGPGTLGSFERVHAMTIFNDGTGDALFAAGEFVLPDGTEMHNVAKWDGTNWTPLSSGFEIYSGSSSNGAVGALTVYDSGDGAKLIVGGVFSTADGVPANNIASWDGNAWAALGGGTDEQVHDLTVFDDGNGAALYAGGEFYNADVPASNIAKWDGTNWSALGSGLGSSTFNFTSVNAISVYNDGSGDALFVSGQFHTAGGVAANNLAKWDGDNWTNVGDVLIPDPGGNSPHGFALTVFDDGDGDQLVVGGRFSHVDKLPASNIASLDGTDWRQLSNGEKGLSGGRFASVEAFAVFDDGGGDALYVGGRVTHAGGVAINHIAKWDGTNWSSLGTGMDDFVSALVVYDDGGGDALYAGGQFLTAGGVSVNHIAKWDGSSWSAVGGGLGGFFPIVNTLTVFTDSSGENALYVGGFFSDAGGVPVESVAKWDGSTWQAVGKPVIDNVLTLQVFDDGGGDALYIGTRRPYVEKWNGAEWVKVGGMLDSLSNDVYALAVFDDGSGDALYAGGSFRGVGGANLNQIAKWNGSDWQPLGLGTGDPSPFSSTVFSLEVFDDGTGEALYVGGEFRAAGGERAAGIAKWDGSAWSPLRRGVDDTVFALSVFDDGSGPALFAGGNFKVARNSGDAYLAKWGCAGRAAGALSSDIKSLTVATGGTQRLTLNGGAERAEWLYFMFGSVTGRSPGIDLGADVVLPLNADPYFTETRTNSERSSFVGFRGKLDMAGRAQAMFVLPALSDPSLVGLTLEHAYLLVNPAGVVEFASNAVSVTLE